MEGGDKVTQVVVGDIGNCIESQIAGGPTGNVVAALESHTGKKFATAKTSQSAATKKPAKQGDQAKTAGEWWGDDYWKTQRNADKWSKTDDKK